MSWGFYDHYNTRLYFTKKNYNLKGLNIFISFPMDRLKVLSASLYLTRGYYTWISKWILKHLEWGGQGRRPKFTPSIHICIHCRCHSNMGAQRAWGRLAQLGEVACPYPIPYPTYMSYLTHPFPPSYPPSRPLLSSPHRNVTAKNSTAFWFR